MRSWNGVHFPPGVATVCDTGQAVALWSIAMNCLSWSGRKVVCPQPAVPPPPGVQLARGGVSTTGRAGKSKDAPLFCVERKTYMPLDCSGSPVVARPRLNIWHERYALPLESQSTDVSPLA